MIMTMENINGYFKTLKTKTIDMKEDDQAMYGCVFPLILFALVCTLIIIWQIVCLVYSSI